MLQVDFWIQCPFFPHFSCRLYTEPSKIILSCCHPFQLFIPTSPKVWLLLSPLAGKHLCCPHLPTSWPSWPSIPYALPVQPLLWLCHIKEIMWLKIKPLISQVSSSIWFAMQLHKSKHWHTSGTGGHREGRAAEAVPLRRKSLQDYVWGSLPRAWPDWEKTFSLLSPWGCHSVGSHPQPDSPHGHTNVTLVTFSKDASIISPLKISMLLWLSFRLRFKSTRGFIAVARCVVISSALKMSFFCT